MSNAPLKPPGSSSSRSNSGGSSSNFAKALLEAGGHVAQSSVDTGVQMASDALASLFGANTSSMPSNTQNGDSSNEFNPGADSGENYFNQEQQEMEWKQREARILRHREVQQTNVYDARQVQTDQKIDELLKQLEALTKELDDADRQAREAQIAVMQGAVNRGDYHVSFFERFISTIMLLRKTIKSSTTWLASFSNRKSQQKGYWGSFYNNGTQWSMSSERSIATSVG